jgi:hypothetical protein
MPAIAGIFFESNLIFIAYKKRQLRLAFYVIGT